MNLLELIQEVAGSTTYKKIASVCDTIWGMLCLATPFACVGVVSYWMAQTPTIESVSTVTAPTYVLEQNESAYVESPLQISPEVQRVAYRAVLLNSNKDVVYRYPEVVISREQGFNASDYSLRFPKGLPAGNYYINVEVIYPLNPIKTANMKVELARVVVHDKGE